MENELLKIFDENHNNIGITSREEVHRLGYWHESIHFWFISKSNEKYYIYLQIRSKSKKDYPGLLDITAAGHILAEETIQDGIREVKEEVGIDVSFDCLIPLGIINYSVIKEDFIDKEIANVFLYLNDRDLEDFSLQTEEVSGIVRAEFRDFVKLFHGEVETINVQGYVHDFEGNKKLLDKSVGKINFVQHPSSYYEDIIMKITDVIGR
ncbi:MAG: hydrolase [Bacillales bacterium]|jgi:isopentenyldiphosphate isomerase|nr:hydrolase [Bacillales bacterium]